jgi:hypothetical protein
LVGKAAFSDRKLVGDQFCRPTWSVTVCPVGKGLSGPTYLCRPTVRQPFINFPDQRYFSQPTWNADPQYDSTSIADQLSTRLSEPFLTNKAIIGSDLENFQKFGRGHFFFF